MKLKLRLEFEIDLRLDLRPNLRLDFSNSQGGWNIRGGGAKAAKSMNVDIGINVEVGFFGKNYVVHNCNKQGVEGGENLRNQ